MKRILDSEIRAIVSIDSRKPKRVWQRGSDGLWYFAPRIAGGADSTEAQIGAGVAVAYWDVTQSPDAYTTIGNIRTVAGIGAMNPEVDSTTLDSPGVERIGGLSDGKEVTIVMVNNAANLLLVEAWIAAKAVLDVRVTKPAPSSNVRYFSVLSLDYDEGTISPQGLLEINFKTRITGGNPSPTDPHA
jgi:hypothetical protein